jgi:hypothetical protein
LSINEDEQLNPLKTNLSVNGIDVYLIEDGNKSSKEKPNTDGRLSSVGNEIFQSRPTKPVQAQTSEELPKRKKTATKSFSSTPNMPIRPINTPLLRPHTVATQQSMPSNFQDNQF